MTRTGNPGGTALQARVISLTTSLDRRAMVAENLKDFPYLWRFCDACVATSPSGFTVDRHRQLARFGRELTPGEIGCFKSHVQVISEFDRDETLEWLLVLEDDVFVDTNFDFGGLVEIARQRKLGYVRLFCRRWTPARFVGWFGEHQIIRFMTDPYGTQAYLISREASRQFRSKLSSVDRPIDDEFARFWLNGLDLYAVFPFPVLERSVASTIRHQRLEAQARRTIGASLRAERFVRRVIDYVAKNYHNRRHFAQRRSKRAM